MLFLTDQVLYLFDRVVFGEQAKEIGPDEYHIHRSFRKPLGPRKGGLVLRVVRTLVLVCNCAIMVYHHDRENEHTHEEPVKVIQNRPHHQSRTRVKARISSR